MSEAGVVRRLPTRGRERPSAALREVQGDARPFDLARLEDGTPHPPTWLFHPSRRWARWVVTRRYPVTVHGREHVPDRGPVILAGNHVGLLDGPLLALFSPRPAHVMTKIEMFDGFLGTLLRATGQIPVDRFGCDPAAIKASVRVLLDGRPLGVFPEGVRGDGELRHIRPGAAYLAMVTGAPIVPVALFGTRLPGTGRNSVPPPRTPIDVAFGRPLRVPRSPWPRTKGDVEALRSRVQVHLRRHLVRSRLATGRALPGPPAPEEER